MYCKLSPWDEAKKKRLRRKDTLSGENICLEPGVNFFVDSLERAGALVRFTCEGHPNGFSIVFDAPYELALKVLQSGYFGIEMMQTCNRWNLNMRGNEAGIVCEHGEFKKTDRNRILRDASHTWKHSEWFVPENV